MRVALRRLRATISAFSRVVADDDCERLKSELRWITGVLGPARDLDVLVADVVVPLRTQNPKQPGVIGICRDLEQRRARAFKAAAEVVRSARYRMLVLTAAEWIEVGPWTKNNDDLLRLRREQPARVHAVDELARRRWRVRRKGRTLKELTPMERHMLRISGKKLRYTVEFFANLFPGKRSAKRCKDTLSALKALQDALGGLNDVAIRESLATRLARSTHFKSDVLEIRERAFAAGVIFGSQEAHTSQLLDAAEAAYTDFRKIKAFWKINARTAT
jgi:triphosphatase